MKAGAARSESATPVSAMTPCRSSSLQPLPACPTARGRHWRVFTRRSRPPSATSFRWSGGSASFDPLPLWVPARLHSAQSPLRRLRQRCPHCGGGSSDACVSAMSAPAMATAPLPSSERDGRISEDCIRDDFFFSDGSIRDGSVCDGCGSDRRISGISGDDDTAAGVHRGLLFTSQCASRSRHER
jgi:hypothetical protein